MVSTLYSIDGLTVAIIYVLELRLRESFRAKVSLESLYGTTNDDTFLLANVDITLCRVSSDRLILMDSDARNELVNGDL